MLQTATALYSATFSPDLSLCPSMFFFLQGLVQQPQTHTTRVTTYSFVDRHSATDCLQEWKHQELQQQRRSSTPQHRTRGSYLFKGVQATPGVMLQGSTSC